MEIEPITDAEDSFYVNRIIMIKDKDGKQNSFYKVIRFTNKMFVIRKIKTQTVLTKRYTDDNSTLVNVFNVKISDEFEPEYKEKKIKKTCVSKYPIIYTYLVQYEI